MPVKSIRYLLLLACIGLISCGRQESTPTPVVDMEEPTPEPVEKTELILDVSGDKVYSVAFSPDGSLLATGSWDPEDDVTKSVDVIRIWDVSSGELLQSLSGHEERVLSVAFSPDGRWLASGDVGHFENAVIWDLSSGRIAKKLDGHESWVSSVAFSPDSRLLASGSEDTFGDPSVKLWDVNSGDLITTLEGHKEDVNSVMFSPDGDTLASGSDDESVKIWDVATHKLVSTLRGHSGDVYSVAFSPDGLLLATGVQFDTAQLWEIASGELIWTHDEGSWSNSIAFSPDGLHLAAALDDGSVLVWDVLDDALLSTLKGHRGTASSVAFSPVGELLASGSSDGTVVLWPSPELYAGVVALPGFEAAEVASVATPEDSGAATVVPSAPPAPEEVSPVQIDAFGVSMVRIPGGAYEVGGNPEQSLEICNKYRDDCSIEWFTDETPIHQVRLEEFMIDQFEVTNEHYATCVDAGVCRAPDQRSSATRSSYYGNSAYDDYPVIYASWEDADAYCTWRGARLPTEEEWETAARGGLGPYPWGSREPVCESDSRYGAKFDDEDRCNDTDTEAVGSYPPNDYLLYDTAGNVMEWTSDWYDAYPGGDFSGSSEYGETFRVARGGSWYTYGDFLRSNIRLPVVPHLSLDHYGIRCASSPFVSEASSAGPTSLSGQDALKDEWRTAINNAILLSSTCQLMFETHFKYGEEEIDLDRARSELSTEGDFIGFAVRGFASGPVPGEAVAPYMLQLEQQTGMLIELLDPIDNSAIGSTGALDTLSATCGALNDLMSDIVNASDDAGLSEASVDELDQEMTPMINDLYDMVLGG